MGLFKSKEEKEAIVKEKRAKQEELAKKLEATRLENEAIAKDYQAKQEAIAKKEYAIKLENEAIAKDYQLKLAEIGLTKMMANSEVYKEIMVIQNDTMINMLAQIVISSQNMLSGGFIIAERERHNNKINDTLRKNHLNNLKQNILI